MPIKTILVVDDSPTERYFLTDLLRKNGFEVVAAETGEDGVAKAKLEKPDLILMDVVMPGLNGFQATRMLSRDAATKAIPVIMCTTKNQETDRVWGLRQGAIDYLVKPIVAEELLAKIKSLGQ
jgi:twitching motility two-component system response regulator PilH